MDACSDGLDYRDRWEHGSDTDMCITAFLFPSKLLYLAVPCGCPMLLMFFQLPVCLDETIFSNNNYYCLLKQWCYQVFDHESVGGKMFFMAVE